MPATRISIRTESGSTLCVLDLSNLHSDYEVVETIAEAQRCVREARGHAIRLLVDLRNSYLSPPALAALTELVSSASIDTERTAFVCEALMERLAYRQVRRLATGTAREFTSRTAAMSFLNADREPQ